MSQPLFAKFLPRARSAFVRAARKCGLKADLAERLEAAACEVSPGAPERVLESRELFEDAAARAVLGDAGNLELSFGLVDALATAVERLGLARASDVPDPFRRIWVRNAAGTTRRGVVLRCKQGEVAVFCPPTRRALAEVGGVLNLSYRGFHSAVDYELRLNDAVRLPGALVLHLMRATGSGNIGRGTDRREVNLEGRVRVLEQSLEEPTAAFVPCRVLDLSGGGLRLECEDVYANGRNLLLDVDLEDGIAEPFAAAGSVCWVKPAPGGGWSYGLLFHELPGPTADRLERLLSRP